MGKRNSQHQATVLHDFYCIRCGNKGISLMRKQGYKHSKMHRKKLYCPFCKEEVNHVECKNMEDVEEFRLNFEKGVYKNEAEESVAHVRALGFGQKHLDPEADEN